MPQGVCHHIGDAGVSWPHRVGPTLELAGTTMTNKNYHQKNKKTRLFSSKKKRWGLSSKGMQGLGSF